MPNPKYGDRYTCFECGTKFYTMKKPEPVCPRCGADQRKAPKKAVSKPPKAPVIVEDFDTEEDETIEEMEEEFPLEGGESFEAEDGEMAVDDVAEEEY